MTSCLDKRNHCGTWSTVLVYTKTSRRHFGVNIEVELVRMDSSLCNSRIDIDKRWNNMFQSQVRHSEKKLEWTVCHVTRPDSLLFFSKHLCVVSRWKEDIPVKWLWPSLLSSSRAKRPRSILMEYPASSDTSGLMGLFDNCGVIIKRHLFFFSFLSLSASPFFCQCGKDKRTISAMLSFPDSIGSSLGDCWNPPVAHCIVLCQRSSNKD